MSQSTPPGWYADPHGLSAYRWWDGYAWTNHINRGQAIAPSAQIAQTAHASYRPGAQSMGWRRNEYAFLTFGIVAVYAYIALEARVYILGIVPVMMSMRSQRRNEPLAIPAIIAAVVAVVIAVMGLTHH